MLRNCSVGLGVTVRVLNSYNDSIRDGMRFCFTVLQKEWQKQRTVGMKSGYGKNDRQLTKRGDEEFGSVNSDKMEGSKPDGAPLGRALSVADAGIWR